MYRDYPSIHTGTRTIFGARVAIGEPILSFEVEYTKGADTAVFSATTQTIKTDSEQMKAGIRSTYGLGSYVFVGARVGGQLTRNTRTETAGGTDTVTKTEKTAPYAGANFGVHLGSYLTVSAGSIMIVTDTKDLSKNDVQNTISVSIGIR